MSSLLSRLGLVKINKESISTENNRKSIRTKIIDEIKSAKEKFNSTNSRNYIKSLIRINNGRGIPSENYINDIKKIFDKYGSVTPCEEYKEKNMNGYKKCEYNKVNYYTMLKDLLEKILKNDVYFNIDENYQKKISEYIEKKSDYLQKKIDKHKNLSIKDLEGGKKILKKSVKKINKK